MKVAFVTPWYDARDIRRGSGTFYYMSREIERQGQEVHYVGPLEIEFPLGTKLFRYISKRILQKRYRSYQDPFVGRRIGQALMQALHGLDYEVLLTNDYAVAGYARTDRPIVLYTDAIFPRDYAQNVHPWLSKLSAVSVSFCQQVTRRGLRRADFCCFPTDWAVCEALQYRELDENRVAVIPFGANVDDPPAEIAAGRNFASIKEKQAIDLLFVGKDWSLKGGDVAVDVMHALREKGMGATLHVVGAIPPYPVDSSSIKVYGLLDKTIARHREILDGLYAHCDVMVLPSKAEGYGVAYVEAAAYGMPSLGYKTTGVQTAVRQDQSGILLDPTKQASDFADVIYGWFREPGEYDRLVGGARKHYKETANWETAIFALFLEIVQRLPRLGKRL